MVAKRVPRDFAYRSLEKYLLNDKLAARTSKAITKRLQRDRVFLEELRAIEDELIVQYAANRLDQKKRTLFEKFFLTSPEKRRQLRFARLFLNAISPTGLTQPVRTFRVFISSTQSDLDEERKTVLDVITRFQMRHGSMEYFGARQDRPLETCLREVRRSDVVIVIIGHRYGSISRRAGTSFTESEYKEAYRFGKDCLIYFRDDSAKILPRDMEQNPKGIERLRKFKGLLLKRHTVARFVDHHDLAVIVATDLATKLAESFLTKQ